MTIHSYEFFIQNFVNVNVLVEKFVIDLKPSLNIVVFCPIC